MKRDPEFEVRSVENIESQTVGRLACPASLACLTDVAPRCQALLRERFPSS
jgi:hypothetical protein